MEYGIMFEICFDAKHKFLWFKDGSHDIVRYPDSESAKNDIQKALTWLMTSVFDGHAICYEGIRDYTYTLKIDNETSVNVHVKTPALCRTRSMSPAEFERAFGCS